jgi:aminoglycoside phosphotransferase family enzyme/predicted kinase
MIENVPSPPRLLLGEGVEIRETHISWVFIAAERVYKVKKPLVLPFLDYGTPARRRSMCRAEVALNRRLASGLYIGVRSLVPAPGGLRLANEDDVAAVDYAVEMRRYDDADTLAARLAAGTAGPSELAAVGERLAAFHAAAPADTDSGGAEAVKRALDDNFATLHGAAPDRRGIARAERSASALLVTIWDELDARASTGRVRDGHGDLRLEHVRLGAEVKVVDCAEFEPRLRRIDVAADLAFLLMELEERGRADLARVLVDSYRGAGGDPGSDRLLAFFGAYRAEVRAKVHLLRAGQLKRDQGAAEAAHESALLALACRLRWRARAPLVIVIAGVSASGKSTVAAALAEASGFGHVNSDVVRKRRGGLRPTDRAPQCLYSSASSRGTYVELGEEAGARARAGEGAIIDATFRRRVDRDAFRAALGAAATPVFVECRAPARVLTARATRRAGDPDRVSDADLDIVRRQLEEAEPFDDVSAGDHVFVRTDRPVAAIVAAISDAVDAREIAGDTRSDLTATGRRARERR